MDQPKVKAAPGTPLVEKLERALLAAGTVRAKFLPGVLRITANANAALHPDDVFAGFGLHLLGDWGEVCQEDWQENEWSLQEGLRLLSVYRDRKDQRFWIITEADRSVTTVLLPEDY